MRQWIEHWKWFCPKKVEAVFYPYGSTKSLWGSQRAFVQESVIKFYIWVLLLLFRSQSMACSTFYFPYTLPVERMKSSGNRGSSTGRSAMFCVRSMSMDGPQNDFVYNKLVKRALTISSSLSLWKVGPSTVSLWGPSETTCQLHYPLTVHGSYNTWLSGFFVTIGIQ